MFIQIFFSQLIMNVCVHMKGSMCVLIGPETFMALEDLALSHLMYVYICVCIYVMYVRLH